MSHFKPANLVCEIKFGSHLYGTATESSDEDYKGIFMPEIPDILLGRIPATSHSTPSNDGVKNAPGQLDCEYYSLHHFLRLATQGQTVAIDMLFAPDTMVYLGEEYGWVWERLRKNRHLFLSKNMSAFVGYARSQAAKYSLKGDRLKKLQKFDTVLGHAYDPDHTPLSEIWDRLPKDDQRINPQGIRELQIAGKWFGETTTVTTVYRSVEKALKRYGNRAHAAANAEGVDWKALSHAVRVSKELIEILSYGQVNFPLVDAPLLLAIKRGERPLEEVQNILDRDLNFIEAKMKLANLPDKPDTKAIDVIACNIMMEYLGS